VIFLLLLLFFFCRKAVLKQYLFYVKIFLLLFTLRAQMPNPYQLGRRSQGNPRGRRMPFVLDDESRRQTEHAEKANPNETIRHASGGIACYDSVFRDRSGRRPAKVFVAFGMDVGVGQQLHIRARFRIETYHLWTLGVHETERLTDGYRLTYPDNDCQFFEAS
jgi:hypothetical protein